MTRYACGKPPPDGKDGPGCTRDRGHEGGCHSSGAWGKGITTRAYVKFPMGGGGGGSGQVTTTVRRYAPGLYRLYWASGGSSLAAIGMTSDGRNWFAPVNWLSPTSDAGHLQGLLRAEAIEIDGIEESHRPG